MSHALQQTGLFDHLIGTGKQCRRNLDAKCPGRDAYLPKYFGEACAVAHQAAGFGVLAYSIDCGNRMARRQRGELDPAGEEERIGADHECIGLVANKDRERSIDPRDITRPDDLNLHPHGRYRCRHFPRYGLGVRINRINQKAYARSSGSKFAQKP